MEKLDSNNEPPYDWSKEIPLDDQRSISFCNMDANMPFYHDGTPDEPTIDYRFINRARLGIFVEQDLN